MTETSAQDASSTSHKNVEQVRVWDPLIRGFHWGLVAAFSVAYLSSEGMDTVHELAGYVVAALIAFRLIWGVIGSKYARFAQFVTGPTKTIGYIGDMASGKERRFLGHNPAGAAMIVALLLALSGTAFTGWLMAEQDRVATLPNVPLIVSPAFADENRVSEYDREGGLNALKDVHEVLANLTLFLIAAHIAGVVLASLRHDENLARSMITGDKRAPGPGDVT